MSEAFDIIFAGGGTTACVVAGRLAATDPSLKILVIESGQHTRDVPGHVQPCRYVENLVPGSATLSPYVAQPSTHLDGREMVVSCGRGVGGGSSINFMLYVRGAASDYDRWASFGNEGWSFHELLPFIRKLETFTPIPDRPSTHGYSGPVRISKRDFPSGIRDQLLKVAREYDPDRPCVDDSNDFVTANAYSPAYHYIDPDTGRRSGAASRYLYPHADNPNVTIIVGKCVKRIVIENGRAVGVEYTTDLRSPQGANDELVTVRVNKLVVVSAGALGSPAILERSGIGARSVLEKNDIPVLMDLPGVGENLQDHVGVYSAFYASDETETMDDVWEHPETIDSWVNEWEESGKGKIGFTGVEVLVKVRPTEAQLAFSGPSLRQRWDTFFKDHPDKPIGFIIAYAGVPVFRSLSPDRKLLSGLSCILYPESIGSVHVTSGEDVNAPVNLVTDFLTSYGDLEQLVLLYKLNRELFRRLPSYRGEVTALHPKFPAESLAACKERDVPVPIHAPDLVYSDADEAAILKYHRDMVVPTWHSLGTCAMKPRDQGGVVDARLNVYGVQGLKVTDLSVCPTNVGNNTYSTALLVGEKAAAIIAEDLLYKYT